VRSNTQILEIEDALGQTPKKTRHVPFEHVAPRAQNSRLGSDSLREGNQIVFVAARAVKQEKRWRCQVGRCLKDMFEAEVIHGRR